MGGAVAAESVVGEGSRFTFTLQISADPQQGDLTPPAADALRQATPHLRA